MLERNFWGIWNRLPFDRKYPFTDSWLQQKDEQLPDRQLFWESIRRLLLLYVLGERSRYRSRFPGDSGKILWIHMTDHLGDSLMRLSPIRLLTDSTVDLLTDDKATWLFKPGGCFRNVMKLSDNDLRLDAREYDCVILDALHTRPLLVKHRMLKNTAFVSQNDFFHYCRDDYNLTLCSWARMAHLLGREIDDLAGCARLLLDTHTAFAELPDRIGLRSGSLGIVVGGREEYRIYRQWIQVVEGLFRNYPDLQLVLLGTENGEVPAREILSRFPKKGIINCINTYTLAQTAALVERCSLVLCADGGLLHVANAVATPTVCLFAQEYPAFRYTPSDRFRALRSEENVNTIEPEAVVREVEAAMAGHWQVWDDNAG